MKIHPNSSKALLKQALAWVKYMGGWDSPMWGDVETYVKKAGEFEIQETLVVGTCHVREEDISLACAQANSQNPEIIAYENEYWVQILIPQDCAEMLENASRLGFSSEMQHLLNTAYGLGCSWVKFDRDGPVYAGFPTFEW